MPCRAQRARRAAAGVFWLEFQQEVAGRCGVRARGARTPPFYGSNLGKLFFLSERFFVGRGVRGFRMGGAAVVFVCGANIRCELGGSQSEATF